MAAGIEDDRDETSPAVSLVPGSVSRRSWLRRAATAAGAAAMAALTRGIAPEPVAAADGATIIAGQQTNAEHATVLFADGTSPYAHGILSVTDTAFSSTTWPQFFPRDAGVTGFAALASTGVAAFGSSYGVFAVGALSGVVAHADSTAVSAVGGVVGVNASTTTGTGVAVNSDSGIGASIYTNTGTGLQVAVGAPTATTPAIHASSGGQGEAIKAANTSSATAPVIHATSAAGVAAIQATGKPVASNGTTIQASGNAAALSVQGLASFTRSGVVTIAGGSTSNAASPIKVAGGLTSSSHVLATMQTKLATTPSIVAAVPNTATGTITIYLSAAPASSVRIAWFVFG